MLNGLVQTLFIVSHDKTIKAWDISANGKCIQTLKSHAHWLIIYHYPLITFYVKVGLIIHQPGPPKFHQKNYVLVLLQQYEK